MAGGRVDYQQLKTLQRQLEELDRGNSAFVGECMKELAARMLAKVTRRTPIGKAPKIKEKTTKVRVREADGRIRTRSYLSAEGVRHARYWAGYQGGRLRRGWTIGEVTRAGGSYQIEVINPELYASYVEYGHRQKPGRYVPALGVRLKSAWVTGKFMMTISAQEIQAIAPRLIERKLEARLRRALDV